MLQRSLFRDVCMILAASIVLAFAYNYISPKSLPLIRKEAEAPPGPDTLKPESAADHNGGSQKDHPDVKVIAPLHERALADSTSTPKIQKKPDVFRIISLDQFRRLMKERKPVIFDARDSVEYIQGHVKGARNVYGLATDEYFERLVPIPRDTLIIIYCNNPECHLGRMLADFMGAIGFTNLLLYDDGWDGWVAAKMPIDTAIVHW
jgi:rhodanese-related sulfurtransferase